MIELNADQIATAVPDEPEADAGGFRQSWRRFRRNRIAVVGGIITLIVLLMALTAPLISIHDPDETDAYHSLTGPSLSHPFGTDNVGRDVMARVIFGARVSIEVGVLSVVVGILLGVPLGAIAGYWSGSFLDELIMRFFDIFIAFPTMILAIAVMGVLGVKPTAIGPLHIDSIGKIVIVTGVVFAPPFARVIRSSFLQEREEQYVQAAKSLGEGNARIIFTEILPNSVVPIIVQATYYLAIAILIEASLSFLGVGIRPPTASWGSMLSDARGYIISGEWWFSVFPGLAILLTMAGLNLLGDGLRDALDPRTRDVGV
jgi:ABC-type dipeptide/oligopeptide/nickel transport system permease subunit